MNPIRTVEEKDKQLCRIVNNCVCVLRAVSYDLRNPQSKQSKQWTVAAIKRVQQTLQEIKMALIYTP
jgi:hypothetical protein